MHRYSDEYSEDESVDIHVRHVTAGAAPVRRGGPAPPHYIQTVRERERDVVRDQPRPYYQTGPVMLQPERTVVRMRSRSRERRSSPPSHAPVPMPMPAQMPAPPPPAPVVINNKIINEQSDSDDYSDESYRHHRHRSHQRGHSRASSTHSNLDDARDRWELEQTRRELEQLKMSNAQARDVERMDRQYREEHELKQAKRELDEIKRREKLEAEEKRIRRDIELRKLEEERRTAEEKDRRDRETKEAIEHYKLQEAERLAKEKKEKELAEKEYQRRLQEDLIRSGLDDKAIEAIMKKEKIKREEKKESKVVVLPPPGPPPPPVARPTYTRMSLRHLDVATLVFYKIDFEYDQEQPGYVIIKRWVPEWEQDMLWEHTRRIRVVEKREEKVVLAIEPKKHHHHKDEDFEWVRTKKTERRRSKSPGLLMYLAGARPA